MFADANISIFAGRNGEKFAERMCAYMDRKLSSREIITFSEGTSFVRSNESVRDRDVYLVCPMALNPNDEFVEQLFWLDAFKRSSAHSITVVMPYFAYAKGDKKDEPRVSIRARVCADAIEMAGADRIMVMDLHAPQVMGFFTKPMDHLYALPLLCKSFLQTGISLDNTVVVSPDAGYAKQARRFGAYLKLPIAICDKTRTAHDEKAEVLDVIGDVEGKNVIIVDDFTISAGTLCSLIEQLQHRNVNKIYAMLSHNLINEDGVKRINDAPIEFVLSTDTVDNPYIVGQSKFKTVSVAPLFAEIIMRYHNYESISELFTEVPDSILPYTII